jgi:hypothetical protein
MREERAPRKTFRRVPETARKSLPHPPVRMPPCPGSCGRSVMTFTARALGGPFGILPFANSILPVRTPVGSMRFCPRIAGPACALTSDLADQQSHRHLPIGHDLSGVTSIFRPKLSVRARPRRVAVAGGRQFRKVGGGCGSAGHPIRGFVPFGRVAGTVLPRVPEFLPTLPSRRIDLGRTGS